MSNSFDKPLIISVLRQAKLLKVLQPFSELTNDNKGLGRCISFQ